MDVVSGAVIFAALFMLLSAACWVLSQGRRQAVGSHVRAEVSRFLRNGAYLFAALGVILVVAAVLELVIE